MIWELSGFQKKKKKRKTANKYCISVESATKYQMLIPEHSGHVSVGLAVLQVTPFEMASRKVALALRLTKTTGSL